MPPQWTPEEETILVVHRAKRYSWAEIEKVFDARSGNGCYPRTMNSCRLHLKGRKDLQ